jgi:hypothetical protein
MSHGPGIIERRIAELFAAMSDGEVLSRPLCVAEITGHAFALKGHPATRAQRLSATRAAHRLIRRAKETHARGQKLQAQARRETQAALGTGKPSEDGEYQAAVAGHPSYKKAQKLFGLVEQWGGYQTRIIATEKKDHLRIEYEFWRATLDKDGKAGRLFFHPVDAPVRVWAVSIQPAGVIWAETEIVRRTERNIIVRYAGETARLDRERLWHWWAFWRALRFVSSRDGRIAEALDAQWQRRYGQAAGGVPPVLQMPLAEAIALLGVPANYTKEDIEAAFRREAKKAHPDVGGTAEQFRKLVEARDRLLAALGTSAPPPKPPAYAPRGAIITYRRVSVSRQGRLGPSALRLGRAS